MSLFDLRTGKKKQEKNVEVVSDLDAIDSEPIGFRFQGRVHVIKPITAGQLLRVYEGFHQLDRLIASKEVTAEELVDSYAKLFGSVCETITRKDVEEMSQAQAGALFALVFDTVTGRSQAEKKKRMMGAPSPDSPSA